ncbi:MAG: adenylyltransferase/cytidyltransferase family protein [Oscillospiraceae bacterium]|nr:adenylyltransferase/cytidyltransferase family protein [Oscillospiraceae bacterium]
MKKYNVGYTAGVYDMFHIGHLNVIRNARQLCDKLIVAVSTDELVTNEKGVVPIIAFEERLQIVQALRYVDQVVPQESYAIEGKIRAAKEYGVDVMFVGDDWKGSAKWNSIEQRLAEIGVDVVYLPHTDGISSTMLRQTLKKKESKV